MEAPDIITPLDRKPEVGDIWRCMTPVGNIFHGLILANRQGVSQNLYLVLDFENETRRTMNFCALNWEYVWVA